MALTLAEVRHIAALARLHLDEDEERRFQQQLSQILEYAARLQAVDTDHIPPTATVLDLNARLRPDEPEASPPASKLLSNAARSQDGMFKVPPVFDKTG